MQKKALFEYAVIRIVPRVEREEFLNVGVILYCADQRFLKCLFRLDESRLAIFHDKFDKEEIAERLSAFDEICAGSKKGGTIGLLPIASRFRWLTAARSTIIQTSPVHPGLCIDAELTLQKLFTTLVC